MKLEWENLHFVAFNLCLQILAVVPTELYYTSVKKPKKLIWNRLELGLDNVAFNPDSNASPDDEGDDVCDKEGDHHPGGREALPLLLLVLGARDGTLGGNTALTLPLLGRGDVGSGAPVPDELRHLLSRLSDRVDVHTTVQVSQTCAGA